MIRGMDVLNVATVAYFISLGISAAAIVASGALALELIGTKDLRQKSAGAGLLLGIGLVVMLGAWIGVQLNLAHEARDLADSLGGFG